MKDESHCLRDNLCNSQITDLTNNYYY